MIDPLGSISPSTQTPSETTRVLRMVKHERMGGSVPVWETVKMDAKQEVERNLSLAQNSQDISSFDAALAYQSPQEPTPEQPTEAFGFGDLVDMINPLHHIPLVGHVYRSLSGDEIKPIGQIVGGAVFGGAVGVASGLVNAVVREETGDDIAGNTFSMIAYGEMPQLKTRTGNNPERALNNAAQLADNTQKIIYDDLPVALLAFTPTAYHSKS